MGSRPTALTGAPADHLTPAIRAAYSDLVSVILWIDEHSKEIDITGDARSLIAAGCFDMALEHQAAIALLVEKQHNGSALALMRVIAEAFIRGMWIARCATDEEVERFQKDNEPQKSLRTLVTEVETAVGNETDTLSNMVKKQWSTLCSFTHTGFRQIVRRYSGALLKPNYPDDEVTHALNFAASIGLLATIELAALSKNLPLGLATKERAEHFAAQ